MDILVVETCIDNSENAQTLSQTLVREQLIACAQIQPIKSLYYWKGKLTTDNEHRIVMKSIIENSERLQQRIIELHSYELPEIIIHQVKTTESYGKWCYKSCGF